MNACWFRIFIGLLAGICLIHMGRLAAAEVAESGDTKQVDMRLADALLLHAGFDDTVDARVAAGDPQIFTAASTRRQKVQPGNQRKNVHLASEGGRYGGALRFTAKSDKVLFYQGQRNVGFQKQGWSGTVSLWLKLDPDQDLEPGFADPIQITDEKWNDSSLFIDFDKELPRDFRLGVFPEYSTWNPRDIAWNDFPVAQRPMVTVEQPPFSREIWTHVAFAWEAINAAEGGPATATLYLDGEKKGELRRPLSFVWDESRSAIMLGLNYIGDMDDLAIFDRALTADEIARLVELPSGVASLEGTE